MQSDAPRRARVYDRLEGQEPQEPARRRFAEVDAAAEALRPGAIVALAFECDEVLAVQRCPNGGNSWALTTLCTDWSSRGTSGWHTHAGDYAVESLEPSCLFRVMRDGRHIALASIAANGQLLCAAGAGDSLGLVSCNAGAWVGAGAAWERQDGTIVNSRMPDKALAVRLLHITCLPTLQLQRVEEFYGGLLHEQHAEKAAALRRVKEMEAERDAALAEAHTWRRQFEEQEQQMQLLRECTPAATSPAASHLLQLPLEAPPDVAAQLAALQRQLESLAADGGLPQLQQERARMSICLRTIKEITDLVRQSATPSSNGSPSLEHPEVTAGPHLAPGHESPSPSAPAGPYATDSEGESRLVDFLGSRPEEGDPLARVLDASAEALAPPESPPRRVLRSLPDNSMASPGAPQPECSPEGLPSGGDEESDRLSLPMPAGSFRASQSVPPLPLPLSDKLSLAVRQLAVSSPHTANGVAQYIATGPNLRASQQRVSGPTRLRSSFLQRPPAAVEDMFYS